MSERVEIQLEIEPDSDPIVGLVRDGDGARHGFRGWVQLMAAVEAARSPEAAVEGSRADPTPGEEDRG